MCTEAQLSIGLCYIKGPQLSLLTIQSTLFISKEKILQDVTDNKINVNFEILCGKE